MRKQRKRAETTSLLTKYVELLSCLRREYEVQGWSAKDFELLEQKVLEF